MACTSAPTLFGRPVAFEPYVGLLEMVMGENMTAVCPAGVGGGSLIYQGMTLQPAEAVFNEWFPDRLDWQLMNRVHYPRVARMLKIAVAPDKLVNSPNHRWPANSPNGSGDRVSPLSKIPMPIDWNYALAELDGKMRPSYTNGDGALASTTAASTASTSPHRPRRGHRAGARHPTYGDLRRASRRRQVDRERQAAPMTPAAPPSSTRSSPRRR